MSSFRLPRSKLRRSVRQERQTAIAVGGKRVAGSGNQPGNKGDVRDHDWLIENKYTDKTQWVLKLSEWRKIEGEALREGKEPAMQVDIAGRRVIILDFQTFLRIRGGAK